MSQQTAVEWLLGTLEQNDIIDLDSVDSNKYYDIINQAKQMEKEQSELRYKDGTPMRKYNSPKLQEIEMENKNLTAVEWLEKELKDRYTLINSEPFFEQAKEMEKEQTEISDEEILKAAKECVYNDLDISVGSFELGARWYREQLKKK